MTNDEKEIQNRNIYTCLEELSKAFYDALDMPFFSSYGSWYDRIKILIKADNTLLRKILNMRADFSEDKLNKCLLATNNCLDILLEEDICRNSPHASAREEYRNELIFFLEKLLKKREYIRKRGILRTEKAINLHLKDFFLNEYLRYEKYLYSKDVFNCLICTVQNLSCLNSIKIDDHISIREITQYEFHNIVEADERDGYKIKSFPKFILYLPFDKDHWKRQLNITLTALRLLRKERIGFQNIYYSFALPCRPWKILKPLIGTKSIEDTLDSRFTLSRIEEERLIQLYKLLNKTKDVGYLAVSLRRFNFAYERERAVDRWIDYFISIESLYSKEGEATEVTHRLATRISRTLNHGSLENKIEFKKKISKLYRIRSKIVHGIQIQVDPVKLNDLEDLLRKSLWWFMSHINYDNHSRIIDFLDLGY